MNTFDQYSVETTSAFFVSEGYSVSATEDQYDHIDLIVENGKGRYGVEVKGRNYDHDFFGDIRVELTKKTAAEEMVKEGRVDAVWAAALFQDNYLLIGNIKYGKEKHSRAPASTYFGSTKPIPKVFWDVEPKLTVRVAKTDAGYFFNR